MYFGSLDCSSLAFTQVCWLVIGPQPSRTHELHVFSQKQETGSSPKLWWSGQIKQFQYVFSSR